VIQASKVTTSRDLTLLPIGPFADPGAPTAIDARCARLSLAWPHARPLCCATGARIDVRAKIDLERLGIAIAFSQEPPLLDDRAPSGVFQRIADSTIAGQPSCAALDDDVAGGGVMGDGCSLRRRARERGLAEDRFLPLDCALFPLDVVDSTLVPSARIPDHALVAAQGEGPTLHALARARLLLRFGPEVAGAIDEAVTGFQNHTKSRAIHLKTLK
jgi:hypothetical protein